MRQHKARDRIRLKDGAVSTVGEALDHGILVVRKASTFYAASERTVEAYFADFADEPGNGWRITPGLYRARMGLPVVTTKDDS